MLKKMGLEGIENAKPFDVVRFPFHGDTLMVSRTGFTGDLGYELWIRPGLALDLWDEQGRRVNGVRTSLGALKVR